MKRDARHIASHDKVRTPLWFRGWAAVLALVMLSQLWGCVAYQLRGKVIDGTTSSIMVVDQDDPRLKEPGIGAAQVSLTLDPKKLSRKLAGTTATQDDGTFELPVSEPGAGMLEYEALVIARFPKMAPAVRFMSLPGSDKRLLITLAPGEDRLDRFQNNIVDETRQWGREFMR